jgi:hypothetical protein
MMIVWKTADDNIPRVKDVVMVTREGLWSSALAPRLVLPTVWQNHIIGSSCILVRLLCERRVVTSRDNTADGVRAVIKDKPIEAKSVERYLESKFGESLGPVRDAMRDLAKAFRPEQLMGNAFTLYEKFQPAIPEGVTGWGAKGKLDIDRIRSLAPEK